MLVYVFIGDILYYIILYHPIYEAHYEGTAEEIWEQCEGHVDMVVICAGTGTQIDRI